MRLLRRRRTLSGLSIFAGLGLVGWLGWRTSPVNRMMLAYTADYRTNTGDIQRISLPDNTRVCMNTATAFDLDFRPDLRRLRMVAGEILIETTKDPARPFVVDTTQGQLRALGTRFTVWQQDGKTLLAVYQGAVEIHTTHSATRAIIPAGNQTHFTTDHIDPLSPADPMREAWAQGDLISADLSLQDLVKELSRYTTRHIGVSPDIAQRRVFGTFPLRDIDATIDLLTRAAHLQARRPLPWWITLEAAPAPHTPS